MNFHPKLRSLHTITAAIVLAAAATAVHTAPAPAAPPAASANAAPSNDIAVVYHVSEVASMRDALNNITNHINTNPGAHITLLANARAVYGLVKNERDRQGEYGATISELQGRGVKFVACRMSMSKNNITEASLLPNVSTVASGVVELTRLQTIERQAYIKP